MTSFPCPKARRSRCCRSGCPSGWTRRARDRPCDGGWALAALLPIGYTRTHLPAYAETETSFPLPFFGYSAIAGWRGQLYAAAIQTDDPAHWLPTAFNRRKLERAVRERLEAEPENRVLAHHAHCALDYACPTASNVFLRRWEGAVAVSAGCNARCVGCISKQEEDELVSPQDRLTFLPTVEEIVTVGVAHLEAAADAIYSFGQGCEGEPLLQARRIEQAIRAMREKTTAGRSTSTRTPATRARCNASTTPGWTHCAPARSRRGARPTTPTTAPSAIRSTT